MTLKFLLPALAFGFLALARLRRVTGPTTRRARLGLAASATALFLVLLSTGTLRPGALVFDPLYNLPLGWLLQASRPVPDTRRARLLGPPRADNGDCLRATEFVRAWPRLAPAAQSFIARDCVSRRSAWRGLAVLAPGFPLMTGAVAPGSPSECSPRCTSECPRTGQRWLPTSMVPLSPGNLLVLPQDDYYQMPYTWGYDGADTFITGLIARNVIDPVAQGYVVAGQELAGSRQPRRSRGCSPTIGDLSNGRSRRIGTPLMLVRGDVNTAFPKRDRTPPAALERALSEDPGMRLVRRLGKLELFAVRRPVSPVGSVTSSATQLCDAGSARPIAAPPWDSADIRADAAHPSRRAAGAARFTMAARR